MNASVKINEMTLEVLGVRTPRQTVDPGTGSALQSFEGIPEPVDRDVVKESGEPCFPVPCCRLTHASEPTWHTLFPAQRPACVVLRRVSLGRAPPSTVSADADGAASLFDSFAGTTSPSDFSRSFID
jgi:hypothetical protein